MRQRRRGLGLTQQQLVNRLGRLGVRTTNKALSNLERGVAVEASKLPELARALECSTTYLLGLTDDPRQWSPDSEHPAPWGEPEPDAVGSGNRPWILGPYLPDLRTPSRR